MDLNNDGINDILSGSYSRRGAESMAGTFQVLYGLGDGTFEAPVDLNGTDDKPLIIPADQENVTEKICTRPTATDWDGDGDTDLIVGNFAGTFYVFKGEGEGTFYPEPEQVMADGEALRVPSAHSDPFVVDWDGDGDMDLLSGSVQGGVYFAENTAGPGKTPELAAFEALIEPAGYAEAGAGPEPTAAGGSTRVWADDVNGDGKLDLLVGDSARVVSYPEGVTAEESQARQAEWEKTTQEISAELQALRDNRDSDEYREVMERYQTHYRSRSEFILEERTGFVWLYLQQ